MPDTTRHTLRRATSAAALLFLLGTAARAQETPAGTPSLVELRRLLDEQKAALEVYQAALEAQKRQLEDQGREIAELRKKTDEASALALASHNQLAELQKPAEPTAAAAVEARLAQVEQEVHRLPELEKTTVTAGGFPGSFRIPGTDAGLRFGGRVRMTSVRTFDALGTDDRFVTSSIPVAGSLAAEKDGRTTYTAQPSRFNFDLRTPTRIGDMRAFIEGDFFGPGNALRLRHAYGQGRRFVLGQTWSTFSDPEAQPLGIDHEGPERDLARAAAPDPLDTAARRAARAGPLRGGSGAGDQRPGRDSRAGREPGPRHGRPAALDPRGEDPRAQPVRASRGPHAG